MTGQLAMPSGHETGDVLTKPAAEASTSGYRYPGSPPFADTDIDRLLFRGRRKEVDQVLHSILSVDLFVVYAISGVGKTSLLTAGVLELLRERQFYPVMLRLNDPSSSPVALIDTQIRAAGDKSAGITVSRHPSLQDVELSTLWDLLSGLEIWQNNRLQHLVLIFDQFEELFTLDWSDEKRGQFIKELGEVLRHHRLEQPQVSSGTPLPPPDVKIVLIIREDSLGELEELAAHVPQIMHHRFRLDGLSPDQAMAAICEPAEINDQRLVTQQFSYSDSAAQCILDFLRAKEIRGRPALARSIDPSQLQIICQHIERSILPRKGSESDSDSVIEISEADLGRKEGLERILRSFYRNALASFSHRKRMRVRRLCETGLVNRNGRRLSLEEGEICAKFGLTKVILKELVDLRLLRAEPRVGSIYYELAHDTLTAPIIAYRVEARRRRRLLGTAFGLLIVIAVVLAVLDAIRIESWESSIATIPEGEFELLDVGAAVAVSASISEPGDYMPFMFDAAADRPLVVAVVPDGGFDPVVQVAGPGSPDRQIERIDTGLEGETEAVVVGGSVAGRYFVLVSGWGGSSGDFQLSIPRTEVIAIGDSVSGAIGAGNPAGVFEFDVPADLPLVVEVVPDDDLYLEVQVTGPEGFDQWSFAAAGAGGIEVVGGSVAGRYFVVVVGFGSTTGNYDLSVRPDNHD